jgi:hypothetical protein
MMEKVLTVIATTTDTKKLRAIDLNAKRLHGESHVIRSAVAARILFLCGPDGIVGDEFEAMRQALIKLNGNEGRLSHILRNRGAIGAIEHKLREPAGGAFREMVAGGNAHLTMEAIVCRHPDFFRIETVAEARKRLADANVTLSA